MLAAGIGLITLLFVGCGLRILEPAADSPTATSQTGLQFAPGYSLNRIYPTADIRFRPAITYLMAVQTVTNLGLQPLSPCTGAMGSQTPWKSISQESSFDATDVHGYLQVTVTPLTAPDWLQRLIATSGVTLAYDGPVYCTNITGDVTPVPGRLYFRGYQAPSSYLAVTFASPSQSSYAQRIVAISNLGFRLADPCVEMREATGVWSSASQQADYVASGLLILATTEANSQSWFSQLRATDGVTQVEAPYTPNC